MSSYSMEESVEQHLRRQFFRASNSFDELFDEMLDEENTSDIQSINNSYRKRNRSNYNRGPKMVKPDDPWICCKWLLLLKHPDTRDPSKPKGKEFRRKFRVPLPVFESIVERCKRSGESIFNSTETLIGGKKAIPLELKIMAVLRTLAGGMLFTDTADATGFMSETTANKFFRDFNKIFQQLFFEEFICPLKGEEFLSSTSMYSKMGLPGCVGSIDVTFVGPWDGCSKNLKNLCDGDKGKGLLYEVIVDHNRLVLSVEGGYYGTINDKTSVKFSKFIDMLNKNELYRDISYKVRTGEADESFIELCSWYVIADGGYLNWRSIMCGYPPTTDRNKYKFTDWVASVRKDVECFFGILKQRFRWFKCPIRLQNKEDIDNAFITACIIHNMILKHDGLNKLWENKVNWKNINPLGEEEPVEEETVENDNVEFVQPVQHNIDRTFIPMFVESAFGVLSEIDAFEKMQALLTNHLNYTYKKGLLMWPRRRSEISVDYNNLPRTHYPEIEEVLDH